MARPNIVFILADDMGYGDFGIFNNGISCTPTLDHVVSEGICLTQHYSASAVCAPARAGLLTGRYPHRTGAIDTLDARGLDRLALRETTMADIFGSAGYTTGLFGKWHLGAADDRYHPNARGFDEFAGFRGGWWRYYDWTLDCNGSFKKADGHYLTDVLTEEAVQFVRRHKHEPFLMHVTYNAPHFPFECPEEDVRPFAETGEHTKAVSTIYGMIHRMDAGIARILDELKTQGLEENTIVIFTSDNGPQFGGEGEMCTDRFNCGYNGSKCFVYEGGIRVPAIIRWPAGLARGKRFDRMAHFTDWLPTLAAAAGVEISAGLNIDGWNILPALQEENSKVNDRRFWQWNRYTPVLECNAAMRDGEWKLVRPAIPEAMHLPDDEIERDHATKHDPQHRTNIYTGPEPDRTVPEPPPAQLFNIDEDPLEQNNLAGQQPQRVSRMLAELEKWFEEVEAERHTIGDRW